MMLGAPPGVHRVSTGLDALSHALESIWNVNANPVSSTFAVAAASEILEALPALARDLPALIEFEIDPRLRRGELPGQCPP